jgi:pimeloyl-ACP methyl ester carboxylesterase
MVSLPCGRSAFSDRLLLSANDARSEAVRARTGIWRPQPLREAEAERAGPDVVLLHGLGDSSIGWQFIEPKLVLAGVGHSPHLEAPQMVLSLVLPFLKKVTSE